MCAGVEMFAEYISVRKCHSVPEPLCPPGGLAVTTTAWDWFAEGIDAACESARVRA